MRCIQLSSCNVDFNVLEFSKQRKFQISAHCWLNLFSVNASEEKRNVMHS